MGENAAPWSEFARESAENATLSSGIASARVLERPRVSRAVPERYLTRFFVGISCEGVRFSAPLNTARVDAFLTQGLHFVLHFELKGCILHDMHDMT